MMRACLTDLFLSWRALEQRIEVTEKTISVIPGPPYRRIKGGFARFSNTPDHDPLIEPAQVEIADCSDAARKDLSLGPTKR